MRNVIFLTAVVLSGLFLPPVSADTFRLGEKVHVGPDEVIEGNLICLGHSVLIEGTVKGNVIAVATEIIHQGLIEKNLWASGQWLEINGRINQNLRFLGQVVTLSDQAVIGGKMKAAGYGLETSPGSQIRNDLRYFGYQALVGGKVGGSFKGMMRAFELSGYISGNVRVKVGVTPKRTPAQGVSKTARHLSYIEPGLCIRESAHIGGMLFYESMSGGNIHPEAEILGNVVQDSRIFPERYMPFIVSIGLTNFRKFFTYLIIGVVLLSLFPYWLRRLAETLAHHTRSSFLLGLLAIILFVILLFGLPVLTLTLSILLSRISLEGISLAVIGLGVTCEIVLIVGFLIYIAFVPQIVASFLAGRWILKKINPDWGVGRILPYVVGLTVFLAVTSIPVFGLLILFVVAVLGLGALWKIRYASPYISI